MADQQYEPFSGKLDAAPEFVPFDGTLDGEKPKPRGAIRAMADLGVGVASGVVGVSKAAANVAGAGNTVSNVLDSADKTVQGWLSPQAQADQQEISAHMSDAKAKGLNLEGVKAGAKAFATAPGQFAAQAVGSAAPFIASALTGPLLPTALGVAVGMGTSKGAIYDEIKKRGGTEEEAIKAQEYGGPNTDQIALGGALGVADALTGVAGAGGRMLRGHFASPLPMQRLMRYSPAPSVEWQPVWRVKHRWKLFKVVRNRSLPTWQHNARAMRPGHGITLPAMQRLRHWPLPVRAQPLASRTRRQQR